jgi:GAF domain-containing protein
LLDSAAGSISLVDERAGYYRKAADLGVACRSGQVFPLDEGVTGQVVAGRRRRFTAGEVDRLETVAQVAAVAITNTRRQAEAAAEVAVRIF